jgi:hypothetical protein
MLLIDEKLLQISVYHNLTDRKNNSRIFVFL